MRWYETSQEVERKTIVAVPLLQRVAPVRVIEKTQEGSINPLPLERGCLRIRWGGVRLSQEWQMVKEGNVAP